MVDLNSLALAVPHWYTYPPKYSYSDAESIPYEKLSLSENRLVNVYVHIPFCNMKCSFCSLYTSAGYSEQVMARYVAALVQEIEAFRNRNLCVPLRIRSLYFGGGTPALMGEAFLGEIMGALRKLGRLPGSCGTVEFSPDTVSRASARLWRKHGFIRASVGVQTFNDNMLAGMGRRHSASDARQAAACLREAGFESVNVDLIFGHAGQTVDLWTKDLSAVSETDATSCTFHPLATMSKTKFERKLVTASPETSAVLSMHERAVEFFEGLGWKRTSAISYARDGRPNPIEHAEARGVPTTGFGAGARSYFPDVHTSTLPSSGRMPFGRVLKEYYDAVRAERKPALSWIKLSEEEQVRRSLVLQMHHGAIAGHVVERAIVLTDRLELEKNFADLVDAGLLLPAGRGYLLTSKGAAHASTIGTILASRQVLNDMRRGLDATA